jgi:hypothetical protein
MLVQWTPEGGANPAQFRPAVEALFSNPTSLQMKVAKRQSKNTDPQRVGVFVVLLLEVVRIRGHDDVLAASKCRTQT